MATMNISLPDQLKQWVEQRATTGDYANSSDYVRDLIRRDREREEARDKLQQVVTDALASGFVDHTMLDIRRIARKNMGLPD